MLVHGRSSERVQAAGERIGGDWRPAVADLGSFAAVRALAGGLGPLEALVNDAGVSDRAEQRPNPQIRPWSVVHPSGVERTVRAAATARRGA